MTLPGQTLTHYRIIEQIGAGGMGVVYRAHDEELERDVALKVLPPGILGDEAARKRFRKEALSLARLNHPNIATIHEFGSDNETDFLVTEYIQGTTLDEQLKDGPLAPQEVLNLGKQLADGLSAAHQQGVIHRDLKPANLRTSLDGRLKVLDFGLAQLAPRASDLGLTLTLSQSQEITGTLPYMAPEQLRGAAIDPRSDLWAAGAVLYEMATGTRPFPEKNAPLLINSILSQEPAPPSKLNPKVSPGLEHVILKALEKDAARRYQSSRELYDDLDRLTSGLRPAASRHRNWRWLAVAVLVLVLGTAAGTFYAMKRQRAMVPPEFRSRRSIAVLGFKNLSGRPDAAWLSTAISEMLTTELAAGEKLLTISGENVSRVKNDLSLPDADTLAPDTLARLRKNLGSDLVVLGSYLDLGDQVRLDLRLQDATAGETIAIVSAKGSESKLDELVTNAGAQLRGKLGIGDAPTGADAAVRASIPTNVNGSRFYVEGLEKLRHFDPSGARDLLLKAVAEDPDHALSYAALSSAWEALGYEGKARDAAKRAFDLSHSLPAQERSTVEAQYYQVTSDWDKALTAYSGLFQREQDNVDSGLKLANVQINAGKPKDALATVARLRALPAPAKDDLRIDQAEARALHELSDFKREQEVAAALATKAEQQGAKLLVAKARMSQCTAFRQLGDPKQAMAACDEAERIASALGDRFTSSSVLNNKANIVYDQGDLPGAKAIYEQVAQMSREIGNQSSLAGALDNIASVLGDQGNHREARKFSQQALAIYRELDDSTGTAQTLNNLGAELVLEGDLKAAQKAFEEASQIWRSVGSTSGLGVVQSNMGDLQLALGNLPSASNAYAEAVAAFEKRSETSKTAYPLVGQGDIALARGDLAEASRKYEQARSIASAANDKHEVAFAMFRLGQVALDRGNLSLARAHFEESRTLRDDMGEKEGVAECLVQLAVVASESGQLDQALAKVREATALVGHGTANDEVVKARLAEAEILLALNKVSEARKVIAAAKALAGSLQNRELALQFQIVSGRISGAGSSPTDLAKAVRSLTDAVTQAKRLDMQKVAMQAQLALAEVEIRSGNRAAGKARLATLENDARTRGFELIAKKASHAPASS